MSCEDGRNGLGEIEKLLKKEQNVGRQLKDGPILWHLLFRRRIRSDTVDERVEDHRPGGEKLKDLSL